VLFCVPKDILIGLKNFIPSTSFKEKFKVQVPILLKLAYLVYKDSMGGEICSNSRMNAS